MCGKIVELCFKQGLLTNNLKRHCLFILVKSFYHQVLVLNYQADTIQANPKLSNLRDLPLKLISFHTDQVYLKLTNLSLNLTEESVTGSYWNLMRCRCSTGGKEAKMTPFSASCRPCSPASYLLSPSSTSAFT